MDSGDTLAVETVEALSCLAREEWDALANPPGAAFDPFVSWDFLQALEESGCVGGASGWTPRHLALRERGALVGVMPLYLKRHSYGEYVFDHAWADALHRAGGRYYPKLQCAAPFTPVPGRRIMAPTARAEAALALAAIRLAQVEGASSVHATFCEEPLCQRLAPLGYLARVGLQYHWRNHGYASFDDFLSALASQKRKTIRRERARSQQACAIRRLRGGEITPAHWDLFYRCYMDTGSRKWGSPYLNRDFFTLVGERLDDRCVLFVAEEDGTPVASALNFLGGDALYGRYWGRLADIPFLHFELCYYQAIEFAIELGLTRVEAGAQGEHKLARGYEPAKTFSLHWIAHAGLRAAVARYLEAETPAMVEESEALAAHTPFKRYE